jgi:hypothetical protein
LGFILITGVVKRASRYGKTLDAASYTLRLIGPDGPMLDPDDIQSDLIVEAQLFSVFSSADSAAAQVNKYADFNSLLQMTYLFQPKNVTTTGVQNEGAGAQQSLTAALSPTSLLLQSSGSSTTMLSTI